MLFSYNYRFQFIVLVVIVIFSVTAQAARYDTILPYPGDATGAVFGNFGGGTVENAILLDGIPIAFKYDDFWSYSAPVLNALQDAGFIPEGFGSYDFSTGTGNLDLVLFTGASGANNQGVGANGDLDFEDPYNDSGGGSTFDEGWWGQNDQDNNGADDDPSVNGSVTVGDMLGYLHEFDPDNNTPVFFVDWNNTGVGDSLLSNVQVNILDSSADNDVIAEWALDTDPNNSYDRDAQALNFGNISFGNAAYCTSIGPYNPISGEGCAGITTSGNTYDNLNHNQGSGKPDFIFFAPSMDLSTYDPDDLFVFHTTIGCETGIGVIDPDTGLATDQGCDNNGFEEGFLTGRIAAGEYTPPNIPEPPVLALFVLGLLGFLYPRIILKRNEFTMS